MNRRPWGLLAIPVAGGLLFLVGPDGPPPERPTAVSCAYGVTGTADPPMPRPVPELDHTRFRALLTTSAGPITIEVYGDRVPCAATAFRHLAEHGYLTDVACEHHWCGANPGLLTSRDAEMVSVSAPVGLGPGGRFALGRCAVDCVAIGRVVSGAGLTGIPLRLSSVRVG